jgi:hypothetical protein
MSNGFTPAMDAAIEEAYHTYTRHGGRHVIANCARELGLEKWQVNRRAALLSLSRPKEPPWSAEELECLRQNRHYSEAIIQRRMHDAGFQRSLQGIRLKRKRMEWSTRHGDDGWTANQLAGLLNVDAHCITGRIKSGLIRAERRGTLRVPIQGGDSYWIRREDARAFVLANPHEVDLRKVNALWFFELLAGTAVGYGDEETTLP